MPRHGPRQQWGTASPGPAQQPLTPNDHQWLTGMGLGVGAQIFDVIIGNAASAGGDDAAEADWQLAVTATGTASASTAVIASSNEAGDGSGRGETSSKESARIVTDIKRRIYRSKDAEAGCYGERKSNLEATIDLTIGNGNNPDTPTAQIKSTVQIKLSDAAFSSDATFSREDCGTRIEVG